MTDKAYLQHLTRGGELLRADRVPEAKSELEKALALKPGDGKILNLLGLACFRLEDYGRAYPQGVLSEEAEILRLTALTAAGDRPQAAARAAAFLATHPHSPLAARARTFLAPNIQAQ